MKVIDMHTHVWVGTAEQDRRELIECVEEVPLQRLYCCGLHNEYPTRQEMTAANDGVYELMKACSRTRGLLFLNPRLEGAVMEEFKRCRDLGFVGVKLWISTKADNPLNFPIYEAAIRHDMPVLLHCFNKARGQMQDETRPPEFANAARRYPECTFLMAHIAADFIAGVESVVGLSNVYVDFSGSYGEKGMIEYAVDRLGADHVMFGSDMAGSDFYHNLGKVTGADIPDEAKELILYGNAARVLP